MHAGQSTTGSVQQFLRPASSTALQLKSAPSPSFRMAPPSDLRPAVFRSLAFLCLCLRFFLCLATKTNNGTTKTLAIIGRRTETVTSTRHRRRQRQRLHQRARGAHYCSRSGSSSPQRSAVTITARICLHLGLFASHCLLQPLFSAASSPTQCLIIRHACFLRSSPPCPDTFPAARLLLMAWSLLQSGHTCLIPGGSGFLEEEKNAALAGHTSSI